MSGRSRLDPKVAFYLKHRAQIDEWIGLRERGVEEANRFFRSLAPAVEDLARMLTDSRSLISLEESHPKLFLYRSGWLDKAAGSPRVAIGLEWIARKALFDNAYSGVWVDVRIPGGKQLQKMLELALKSYRESEPAIQVEPWWPAWRYERPAAPDYWEHLDALRDQILTSLSRWWEGCADVVDRVARAAATGGRA